MPYADNHWQVPRFPKFLMLLFPVGCLVMGWGLTDYSPLRESGTGAVTITRDGKQVVSTVTDTVERKVRGRIVRVADKVYVRVPLVVVHVDHRTIRVPAHRLRLNSALAVTADPLVTVYVPVTSTVTVPGEPVTIVSTVTVTSTEIVPTTITVTLPIFTTGGGPDT